MTQTDGKVDILDLRDRSGFVDAVVQQNFETWHHVTDLSIAELSDSFPTDNPIGTLPVTLLALIDDRYAGCVSLRDSSLGMIRHPEAYLPEESPWLSNMWVADWARGNKLATLLTRELESTARSLDIPRIFTSANRPDSLYHKLGYVDIGQRRLKTHTIYLMSKSLRGRRS